MVKQMEVCLEYSDILNNVLCRPDMFRFFPPVLRQKTTDLGQRMEKTCENSNGDRLISYHGKHEIRIIP